MCKAAAFLTGTYFSYQLLRNSCSIERSPSKITQPQLNNFEFSEVPLTNKMLFSPLSYDEKPQPIKQNTKYNNFEFFDVNPTQPPSHAPGINGELVTRLQNVRANLLIDQLPTVNNPLVKSQLEKIAIDTQAIIDQIKAATETIAENDSIVREFNGLLIETSMTMLGLNS